ncbi:MAG: hypothetical protein ACLP19_28825 [Xanthobacteraceae bacterium]
MMTRGAAFFVLASLLVRAGFAFGQPAEVTWPDAVAQLAGERSKAETCVALVKKYGSSAQIAHAQLTYTDAKADSDAVIAGLITVLSTSQAPASLPSVQAKLTSSVTGLGEFCGTVASLLPNTAGQKNVLTDIAKVAIGPLLEMLSDGVSALYNNHRADDALTRGTIKTQLEAARWPAFSEVKPAQ